MHLRVIAGTVFYLLPSSNASAGAAKLGELATTCYAGSRWGQGLGSVTDIRAAQNNDDEPATAARYLHSANAPIARTLCRQTTEKLPATGRGKF